MDPINILFLKSILRIFLEIRMIALEIVKTFTINFFFRFFGAKFEQAKAKSTTLLIFTYVNIKKTTYK